MAECAMQAAQGFKAGWIVERVEQVAKPGAIATQVSLSRSDRILAGLANIRGVRVEHDCLPCMHERCWCCLIHRRHVFCGWEMRCVRQGPFGSFRRLVLVTRTLVVLLGDEEEIYSRGHFFD